MRIEPGPAFLIWAILESGCFAQKVIPFTLPAPCVELNHSALVQTATGYADEAEREISAALAGGTSGNGPACSGLVLSNLAASAGVSGRFEEAEAFAERAVHVLEGIAGPKGPALLRPLEILAFARLEQGKVGKARQAFQRMQLIPAERPDSQALVHGLAAVLLQMEGNSAAAEAEFREALRALEQAGLGNTADTASTLIALGGLYIKDGRFDEAAPILDRARSVFDAAPDTVPMDRIRLLHLRAVLYARRGQWQKAEEEMRSAIAMADQQKGLDSAYRGFLLVNYAQILRKNHHRREARSIEARAAAEPGYRATRGLVDVSELSIVSNSRR